MTNKKIQEIADFMYSSNSSTDVPFRLSISTGQYAGFDLSKDDLITLFKHLRDCEVSKYSFEILLEMLMDEDNE